MKKIQPQPRVSTSTPPRIGPTSEATPAVAPQMLMATPRAFGGNISVIRDMVCGVISDAPKPCTTRAVISDSTFGARPHHREASVKIPIPIMYRFFCPKRSPIRPVMSSGTAYASR